MSDKAATISTDVTAPVGGPMIDTDDFQIPYNSENNTDTLTNLAVTDADSGAATDIFTVTAATAHSGTSVTSVAGVGLAHRDQPDLPEWRHLRPGSDAAGDRTDQSDRDRSEGRNDTVHFIFNEAGDTSHGVTLNGTSGKDVIFATDERTR